MKYEIAIVDDEKIQRAGLVMYLESWASKRGITIQISEFASGEGFVFAMAEKLFDIVILDIEMSGLDGIATAKKIRKTDKRSQIIFVTGYSEYIAFGYDVEALNYLLKPVDEEKFASVLDKAIAKLNKKSHYLTLKNEGEVFLIPLETIRYFEVSGNYTTIHADKDYMIKRTLSTFDAELDDAFIKVSRSYIVALKEIKRVTRKELTLKDGTTIRLPRGAYDKVSRAIIERL